MEREGRVCTARLGPRDQHLTDCLRGAPAVFVHFSSIVEVRKGTNGFKSLREAEEVRRQSHGPVGWADQRAEQVEYDPKRSRKGWLADNVTGPRGQSCLAPSTSWLSLT